MSMLPPVLGFRLRRAGRLVVEKVSNPVMTTGSPFARRSWMASNTAATAAATSAFDREALLARWDTTSDFLNSLPLSSGTNGI